MLIRLPRRFLELLPREYAKLKMNFLYYKITVSHICAHNATLQLNRLENGAVNIIEDSVTLFVISINSHVVYTHYRLILYLAKL